MFVSFWQMAFWQNRSISLVDMYIDNSEPTENVGQIHFSLEYDFQNTTLILKIMQVCTHTLKKLLFFVVVTFNIPRLRTFVTIAWRQSTFGRYQFAACIIESLIQVVSIWKRSFGYSGRETNDKNKEIACSNQIELRDQADKPAARKKDSCKSFLYAHLVSVASGHQRCTVLILVIAVSAPRASLSTCFSSRSVWKEVIRLRLGLFFFFFFAVEFVIEYLIGCERMWFSILYRSLSSSSSSSCRRFNSTRAVRWMNATSGKIPCKPFSLSELWLFGLFLQQLHLLLLLLLLHLNRINVDFFRKTEPMLSITPGQRAGVWRLRKKQYTMVQLVSPPSDVYSLNFSYANASVGYFHYIVRSPWQYFCIRNSYRVTTT